MTDIAMVKSGFDRVELDYYPTPSWITELVCDYVEDHFGNINSTALRILEPACGEGHMSKVMEEHGFSVDSYDLVNRGYGLSGVNFLTNPYDMAAYDGIITNPPYGDMAKKFIARGLDLIEDQNCFMAMVLRNEFDCAKGVMDLFGDNPMYHGKLILTKRPLWIEPKPGEKAGSPRHNYAIFFWYGSTSARGLLPMIQYAHPELGYKKLWS